MLGETQKSILPHPCSAESMPPPKKQSISRAPYGEVPVKVGRLDGSVVQAVPEFESWKNAAEAANVPSKTVYETSPKAMRV